MRLKPIPGFYFLKTAVDDQLPLDLILMEPRPAYSGKATIRDEATKEVLDCFHILDECYNVGRGHGLGYRRIGSMELLVMPASDLFDQKFIRHSIRLRRAALKHLFETGVMKPTDQRVRMWVEMWPDLGSIDLDTLRRRAGKGGFYVVSSLRGIE